MQNVVVFLVMLAGLCGRLAAGLKAGLCWRCVGWLLIWNVDGIARRQKLPHKTIDGTDQDKAGTLAKMNGGKLAALALA